MKKLIVLVLLFWAVMGILFAQESGQIVMNPLTGELEYVTNPYPIGDSLINLGYDNNIDYSTLSTMVGFGNYLGSPDCIVAGWDNHVACGQNFAFGKNIKCNSDKVIMIGMSPIDTEARMPGSVAFCPGGELAVMHVHSGYRMPNDGFDGNKGGVRIGRGPIYADGNTALEVIAHRDTTFASKFGPPSGEQIIATENDQWVVDPDGMALSGAISTGFVSSPHTPQVYSAAADTSFLPTPEKVGDYFIDTSARNVYIAVGVARGSWRKVN